LNYNIKNSLSQLYFDFSGDIIPCGIRVLNEVYYILEYLKSRTLGRG